MSLAKFVQAGAVAAGALAFATQVNAADMYAGGGGYKDAPIYAPAPIWTGFYLGAHVGGAWSTLSTTDVNGHFASAAGYRWNNDADGFEGGGQIGYNIQYGSIVFGPEVDFGVLDLNHSVRTRYYPTYGSKIEDGFNVNATGRLGYAAGAALFYAKGGYSYLDSKITFIDPLAGHTKSVSGLDGWTLGAGIEYAFGPTWSVKGEYRYADYGRYDLHPTATTTIRNEFTVNTVEVGLNYHLGRSYEPLK